jgi:hypothetical protein
MFPQSILPLPDEVLTSSYYISRINNHLTTVIQRMHTKIESYNVRTLFTASILQQALQNRPLLEVNRLT